MPSGELMSPGEPQRFFAGEVTHTPCMAIMPIAQQCPETNSGPNPFPVKGLFPSHFVPPISKVPDTAARFPPPISATVDTRHGPVGMERREPRDGRALRGDGVANFLEKSSENRQKSSKES